MDVTLETEVVRILLELPQLVYESEQFFNSRFPLTWGAKRRRSSSSKVDSPPAVRFPSLPSPPSAAPMVGPSPSCEPEKSKALSPSTPLLFSPSESDDKSKLYKRKVSLKRKREESLQMIDKLTENKQSLQEQIKNAQRHYDQLKALNLKLKARKHMVTVVGLEQETHQIQLSSSNLAMEPPVPIQFDVQDKPHGRQQQSQYTLHKPPFIMDQNNHHLHRTAHNNPDNNGQSLVSFMVNDSVGPVGIPDLNVSLENSFELETEQQPQQQHPQQQNPAIEAKALAAQARQRRLQICRAKNNPNVVASKLRFPVCR